MNAPLVHPATFFAPVRKLDLQVISSIEAMQELAGEWRELLAEYRFRNLFLTPAWNIAWWHAFGHGKELRLLVMRSDSQLAGIFPLMVYPMRLRGFPVRVLGTFTNPHVSRCDLITALGFETAVAECVAAYLADSVSTWDVALLQQFPADAPWRAPLVEALHGRRLLPCEPVAGVGKCRLALTERWDAYVARRGSHFRRNIGKTERRVERGGSTVYRHLVNPAPDSPVFDLFADIERRSWKDDAGETAHLGQTGWAFHREFATACGDGISSDNWIVELDDRPVAMVHTVAYDRVNYCFQTIFDEQVRDLYIGRAAVTRHFQSVFDGGEYDSLDLNGNSDFCKSWTSEEQSFITLPVYHRRPYSLLLWSLRRLRRLL